MSEQTLEALTNIEKYLNIAAEYKEKYQAAEKEIEALKKELKRRSLPKTKKSNKQLSLI